MFFRWLAPFLLLVLVLSNAQLLDRPGYRKVFALQLAFYALAGLGAGFSKQKHLLAKLMRVPYYFVGSNVALLVGCYKCVTGRQQATWSQKAHRTE